VWINKLRRPRGNSTVWSNFYSRATNTWGNANPAPVAFTFGNRNPQLVYDAQSGAFVGAWPTETSVTTSRWSAGQWGTLQTISNNSDYPGLKVQIAGDAGGNVVATWAQPGKLWLSRYTPTGGWGPPIQSANTPNARDPQIALDTSGTGIVVWDEWRLDGPMWFSRYVAGVLAPARPIGPLVDFRQVVLNGGGNASVIGQGSRDANGDARLSVRHYTASTDQWSAEQLVPVVKLLPTEHVDLYVMQAAGNGSGDLIAVWTQVEGSASPVPGESSWAAWYTGNSWHAPVRLDHGSNSISGGPLVRFDEGGDAVAVWAETNNGLFDIWSGRFE
jgi:hypothetical protein